jgi:ribonuclease P protein component
MIAPEIPISELPMTDQRFPKRVRLLGGSEFRRVLAARCSHADRVLVVYGAINEQQYARLGLTVSRAVGPAVVRNRWKRALREAFRLAQHELPPLDLVVIPRSGAEPDVGSIGRSLRALAARVQQKLASGRRSSADPPRPRRKSP